MLLLLASRRESKAQVPATEQVLVSAVLGHDAEGPLPVRRRLQAGTFCKCRRRLSQAEQGTHAVPLCFWIHAQLWTSSAAVVPAIVTHLLLAWSRQPSALTWCHYQESGVCTQCRCLSTGCTQTNTEPRCARQPPAPAGCTQPAPYMTVIACSCICFV